MAWLHNMHWPQLLQAVSMLWRLPSKSITPPVLGMHGIAFA